MFESKVKRELDLPVGIRCIQQVLQFSEHLKYKKRQRKPHLTKQKKEFRLNWDKKYVLFTNWNNVMFSDKKKFNLDGQMAANFILLFMSWSRNLHES